MANKLQSRLKPTSNSLAAEFIRCHAPRDALLSPPVRKRRGWLCSLRRVIILDLRKTKRERASGFDFGREALRVHSKFLDASIFLDDENEFADAYNLVTPSAYIITTYDPSLSDIEDLKLPAFNSSYLNHFSAILPA